MPNSYLVGAVVLFAALLRGSLTLGQSLAPLSEAAELRALVQAGKLPRIADRVGQEPLVVAPGMFGTDSTGEYGGKLHLDAADAPNVQGATDITIPLFLDDRGKLWPLGWKSYEKSDDSRTWTFQLRRGMKWSDGRPYTTADVLFWYYDVALNGELNPSPPPWILSAGKPAEVEALSESTVQFRFANPYLNFDYMLATSAERQIMSCPKHYLSQFHPKYTDSETLRARVKAAGMQTWTQLWESQLDGSYQRNTELPTLCPWTLAVGVPSNPVIYRRNPYYWMIDSAGKQLPYTDECWVTVVGNAERMKLRSLAGSVSYGTLSLDSAEIARRAERRGRVRIGLVPLPKDINSNTLSFNFVTPDPQKRALLNDRRFRIAMSLQMPREQISQIVDNGLTRPKQIGVSDPTNPLFCRELAEAHLRYDLAEANRLLDEAGLSKRDSTGQRVGSDGQPITFSVITINAPAFQTPAEIFVEFLAKVGLRGNLRVIGWDALADTLSEGRWELFMWQDLAGSQAAWPQGMDCFRPSIWNAWKWHRWLESGGQGGSEPPPLMKKCWDLWMAAQAAQTVQERDRAFMELQRMQAEHLFAVGVNSFPPVVRVVHPRIRNVPFDRYCFLSSAAYYQP